MQKITLNRKDTQCFSNISNTLTYNQALLKDFIQLPFSIESIKVQIELKSKNYPQQNRVILTNKLNKNYSKLELTQKQALHLNLLSKDSTFTITTGHQLCLFTGPIFFIYKIIHTIKLADELCRAYPEFHFVPIYWMASEDHDFEEVNHLNLFNNKITWNTNQTGAVGNFKLNEINQVKNEIKSFFLNRSSNELDFLLDSFNGNSFSEATFSFVNELFKEYGLIILEPNDKKLKLLFTSTIKNEIQYQFSNKCVEKTNQELIKSGIKPQVNSRLINLFYINENIRSRIILENGLFKIENVGEFKEEELLLELEKFPERFSPNVVLRTLYQETILPNLVYIGGGGELAYWLQFKQVFDHENISFPLIKIRNSIQLIDKNSQKKISKLNLDFKELFKNTDLIKKDYLLKNSSNTLDFNELNLKFNSFIDELKKSILNYDINLTSLSEAESTKFNDNFEVLKNKILKLEKTKHEVSLKQIEDLKSKLFPNNALQERNDNFLNFCQNGDYKAFIAELFELINVYEKDLILGF
jgi:bacillithiol synthase